MLHFSLTAGDAKEQMNYILMPSLEHRALTKTAITLWNPDDIQLDDIQLEDIYFQWRKSKWIAEDHVIGKVKELPLPESLKKKISGFIKPIGFEILAWIDHYQSILSSHDINDMSRSRLLDIKTVGKSLSNLCWTPQGTVDRKKTVEELIEDENLDITERYKLACVYCLKNAVLRLWNKMPEDLKKKFYNKEDPRHINQDRLVVFWTYDIKGEVSRMHHVFEDIWHRCTPYQYAFHCAVFSGIKEATEYFLQKLTSEEKEESLERSVYPNKDTLWYLLSQMNEVQQVGMLRRYAYVLSWLLDWPFQGLFMELAKHMWGFLPVYEYFNLLEEIIVKVKTGYKDYDYRKIFREFWQQSPLTHKEFVTNDLSSESLLLDLLQIKDKENLKLILEDTTALEREKVIFSNKGKDICETLIHNDEMDLLEFFVQECISSKDVMIKFRKEFEESIIYCRSKETLKKEKDMWNKGFQLLNELIQKYDKKRCVEEGNNGPVKRHCSLRSEK